MVLQLLSSDLMTTLTNQTVVPASSTTGVRRGVSLREALARVVRRMTWLKPPFRTAMRLGAWMYSTRNILRQGEITWVQVGCGKNIRSPWWNVDLIHFPGVDEIRDATLPWRHRGLQYVFAEHFIEHLTLHDGLKFLRHAGNALRPGGVIRLSTPNLTHVVLKEYRLDGPSAAQRLNDTVALNGCFHGYGHKFLYSAEFLRFVLEEMGFENVREYDFNQSDIPDLRGLERHGPFTIEQGIPNIITFEAMKGSGAIAPSDALLRWLDRYFDDDVYR